MKGMSIPSEINFRASGTLIGRRARANDVAASVAEINNGTSDTPSAAFMFSSSAAARYVVPAVVSCARPN